MFLTIVLITYNISKKEFAGFFCYICQSLCINDDEIEPTPKPFYESK